MVSSLGIGIIQMQGIYAKLNSYGFKNLGKLGPAFSETNTISFWFTLDDSDRARKFCMVNLLFNFQ